VRDNNTVGKGWELVLVQSEYLSHSSFYLISLMCLSVFPSDNSSYALLIKIVLMTDDNEVGIPEAFSMAKDVFEISLYPYFFVFLKVIGLSAGLIH